MTVTFQRVTMVRAPCERVFELSLRTDLHEGSMSRYRERAPGGPVGRIAERLLLGRYIERLIDERNSFLAAQAEGGQ